MPDVNVDLIGLNGGSGQVANMLMANGSLNIGRMRPFWEKDKNGRWGQYVTVYQGGDPKDKKSYATVPLTNATATLRRDEWKQLDQALLDITRFRLGGVQDLIDNGLTYQLGNAMGTTVLEWHDVSDAMEATMTMDAVTRSKGDRVVFQHNYLPIPIIHVDWELNARALAASRNLGNPLDTLSVERAARKILEKLERILFTEDAAYTWGETDSRTRNAIYGYLNHPDRNTSTISIPWDSSAVTAGDILNDVLDMVQTSTNNYHYGPWMVYIPTHYQRVLDDDYDVAGSSLLTVRERILKVNGIKGVKVVDTLPDDNVLLVEMNPQTVRLVQGLPLQNIEWSTEGGMITKYKTLTIQVPQIRSDQNGKCGIVHMSC